MKKVLFIIGITVALFTSCKKEKTCTCTQTMDGDVVSTTSVTTKEDCSDMNTESTVFDITTKMTCVEK